VESSSPETRKRLLTVVLVVVALASGFAGGYGTFLATQVSAPRGALTLIDDLGRVVSVPPEVTRIVSLAPSTTEILFAMDLGPRLVAVDAFSDYPPELEQLNLTRVETFPSVNLETILSLSPDLVLAAGITPPSDVEQISARGIAVLVLQPRTIEGILQDILLVGLATGTLSKAREVVDGLQARIDAILAITTNATLVPYRPLVYLEFFPLWTFGPGSFGHDLITMAGGRNVGATLTSPFAEISNEFVIAANPDIIVYTEGPYTATTREDIEGRPGWDQIKAVQEGKIFTIDDNEVARPGPRIVDALEDLAKVLHPDLFTEDG
jgi:iron complex transport system substrate-binding protein